MPNDANWLNGDEEEELQKSYPYYMRMDPDNREFLGPVEFKYDPIFGREVKQRQGKVGLTRGVKPENMRDTTIYLEPYPHLRIDKGADLRGWYSGKTDGANPRERDRPCMTDAILTTPYTGTCPVQCPFCYLDAGFRGYRATGLIAVPMGYGAHVKKQLSSMNVSAAGYFTSFHEPFNQLEPIYHNTQEGAQAFVDVGLPIFFLSRRSYPGWAFDLLLKNKYSYMQKSLNTPNEEDWRLLSPGAISLAEHFAEIREARRRGIYVSIQCNPIIPGIVDHVDIERLIALLAEAGANHVIFKFVENNHPWVESFLARMTQKFGANRTAFLRELFVEKQAGNQTTITEEYRREGHERYRRQCQRYGLTSALCYEYTQKPDGVWKSMGPEFLTADQCHGKRCPVHVRKGSKFVPLSVCPPSGCLTCADGREDGKGKCGSALMGEAKALRISDLRKPFDGKAK